MKTICNLYNNQLLTANDSQHIKYNKKICSEIRNDTEDAKTEFWTCLKLKLLYCLRMSLSNNYINSV